MAPTGDPELVPLWSAIEAYSSGAYQEAIVPAAVAVEYKLASVLRAYFKQFAGEGRVDDFLQNGVTFSYQLNPLLPAVMHGVGAPKLRDEVANKLSWLRGKRNKVAHKHEAVTQDEAADAVVAALFGYQYLALYGPLPAKASP
ncbi:hypothetical protein Vqi01_58040 [Micromonospora qiuiae]|uniref:Uncharacterized protein n=2 Tax=Micromonospora qiuiae TaxID=502268 RepID=A0ABQ4JM29_9ACTN|nr:hypothetical protein Vqi01_58040 [Micromonospora qiuiae]